MELTDKILEIVNEAKEKNYPEFILKADLDKLEREVNHEIRNSYDEGFEEAKERVRDHIEALTDFDNW